MTFTYKKKGKQISALSRSNTIDSKMCDPKLGATHVVTEVKTGFNAFLLFESYVTGKETKKETSGSLQVIIQSIPAFKVDAKADVKFTEEENKTL